MRRTSSPLVSAAPEFFEDLHQRFLADPASVDPSWRVLFQVVSDLNDGQPGAARNAPSDAALALALEAYRSRGHLVADIDPLGLSEGRFGCANAPVSDDAAFERMLGDGRPAAIADQRGELERARRSYAGSLAIETAHIDDAAIRAWLINAVETGTGDWSKEERLALLGHLVVAEEFERFLGAKAPTKKRFGAEGAEAVLPMLHRVLDKAVRAGVTQVVIGSMHRGRLNIMANLLGESLVELLTKFKGAHPFPVDQPIAADVPYHLGLDCVVTTPAGPVAVTLAPNPSHLEAINPVVLGRVRARQDLDRQDPAGDARRTLGIIVHTDASVIGQGSIAEMIQLGGPAGFTTAGTIHVIINNQIGFTTEQEEARTSRYCTGLWKSVDSAILHVNGNDPEAALRAADIAFDFRQAHRRDAVIDLVCYRRNGHNEIDEPRFTQPLLYKVIDVARSVGSLYAERLIAAGVASESTVTQLVESYRATLQEAYAAASGHRLNRSGFPGGRWSAYDPSTAPQIEPDTGLPEDRLRVLLERLAALPAGFNADPKVVRVVQHRADADAGLPWATAEGLAFATLLKDGVPVRLTGQDVVRGAFSHRHYCISDIQTGTRYVSLNHLGGEQARFDVVNSPLSEYAVLGFEYGYSLERPDALVIWEAQFGDFANGAQIMIDQFVTSGEEKWMQPSGLVVLLPHGLEGQGPEHSSARVERFLQLAAKDNIQIANPSTPANYFHLLRRQVLRRVRKPLFVTSPKTLLRLPAALSALADFGPGTRFSPVLTSAPDGEVRRVLLCTGKLAYELERERAARAANDVAIVRLEMLYPLPAEALTALMRRWPDARYFWVQEEAANQGAWSYLDRRLEALLRAAGARHGTVTCVSRLESPSPAASFHGDHDKDQQAIVQAAFA